VVRSLRVYKLSLLILPVIALIGILASFGCTSSTPEVSTRFSSMAVFGRGLDGDAFINYNVLSGDILPTGKRLVGMGRIINVAGSGRKLTMENNVPSSTYAPNDEVMWYAAGASGTTCGKDLEPGRYGFGLVRKVDSIGSNITDVTLDRPISSNPGSINNGALKTPVHGSNDPICVIALIRVHNFKNLTLQNGPALQTVLDIGSLEMGGGLLVMKVSDTLTIGTNGAFGVTIDGSGSDAPARGALFAGAGGQYAIPNHGERGSGINAGDGASTGGGAGGGGGGGNLGFGDAGGGGGGMGGAAYPPMSGDCPTCRLIFIGGSGGGGDYFPGYNGAKGGGAGGMIMIAAKKISFQGNGPVTLKVAGQSGFAGGSAGGGGGGAGGSVFVMSKDIGGTMGSFDMNANGGAGGTGANTGGGGGGGMSALKYCSNNTNISDFNPYVYAQGGGTGGPGFSQVSVGQADICSIP
jgi:hypothetical protein